MRVKGELGVQSINDRGQWFWELPQSAPPAASPATGEEEEDDDLPIPRAKKEGTEEDFRIRIKGWRDYFREGGVPEGGIRARLDREAIGILKEWEDRRADDPTFRFEVSEDRAYEIVEEILRPAEGFKDEPF